MAVLRIQRRGVRNLSTMQTAILNTHTHTHTPFSETVCPSNLLFLCSYVRCDFIIMAAEFREMGEKARNTDICVLADM